MKIDSALSPQDRQEILKDIIRRLHAGVPVKKLQSDFAKVIYQASPEEIAAMENALIEEGFPPEEIQRLCEVHAEVFERALSRVKKSSKIPGHPIHTYLQENQEATRLHKSPHKSVKSLKKGKGGPEAASGFEAIWDRFKAIEIHYVRKENQLFPALEAIGFTGPTKVMWGKHDEIRRMIKAVDEAYREGDYQRLAATFADLASAVKKMIFLEEKILFPTAARKLDDATWAEIRQGEPAIGYAWVQPGITYDPILVRRHPVISIPTSQPIPQEKTMKEETDTLSLTHGHLTPEQVDLILRHLPVDISFVDENDTVCYYNETSERIFPRSPGVIGRKVQNCHPPKSVHVVERILRDFREKRRKVAEFWIQKGGAFIHIRYFPIYDSSGTYRGVIEVTQEVSGIRKLEGERRILEEDQ